MSAASDPPKSLIQRFLDVVEKVGNRVPHPAIIFLVLIAMVIVLSHVLERCQVKATYQAIVPRMQEIDTTSVIDASADETSMVATYQAIGIDDQTIETRYVAARSLLTSEGLCFVYTSVIPNFMGFTAVGLIIVAMLGVGVAEASGLVNALIRSLVVVSPRWALTYILVFGILSSIAADAGYLVLIPLAGTAFLSVGRHPVGGTRRCDRPNRKSLVLHRLRRVLDGSHYADQ